MKYLKWFLGILFLLIVLIILYVRIAVHEARPTIDSTGNADVLADQMLQAVNKAAWDTLPYVSWSFRGEHDYIWDRINNDALVSWENYRN